MKTLHATCLAVVRLELSKVDSIVQIGNNIEFDSPMYVIVFGRDTAEEKKPKSYIISVNYEGGIHVVQENNLAEFISSHDSMRVFADQPEVSVDNHARLILQSENSLKILKIIGTKANSITFELERDVLLKSHE